MKFSAHISHNFGLIFLKYLSSVGVSAKAPADTAMSSSGSPYSNATSVSSPPSSPDTSVDTMHLPLVDEEDANFFAPYNDLLDFLTKYEASVRGIGAMSFLHLLTDWQKGKDWNHLNKALQDCGQDPLKIRLNLMDVLRLLDVECSVSHIELGWHLTVLEKRVLPAIREIQFLRQQCTDALSALQSGTNGLDKVFDLACQRPHDQVIRLRQRHERALSEFKRYEAVGQIYCRYPTPLATGDPANDAVDMRCMVPIYILNT